ncbi:RNA polymerase subunit sigma [Paenibacillus tengchongensis]|uniref:RNA polymerase subunit sigma n=1 Tax=Paenibacillus tengchongensis TaxID=2608684 RepID=UPI00124EA03B|nr:RNA polymerase subunit sigma [Paenibacillus tengchongensis]
MGSVKYDTETAARAYSTKYNLETAAGVKCLLRDFETVHRARVDHADYAAADILIDLNAAGRSAGLTAREAAAITRVYRDGLTHKEAALALGVPASEMTALIDSAIEKITEVYKRWEYGEVYATVIGSAESEQLYEVFEEAA